MIRWYDWVAAFVVADLLTSNLMLAVFAEIWWHQTLGTLAVFVLWDAWNDLYCKVRKNMENRG